LFPWCKGGLTPRQQLATYYLQHFLVMTGNITKKCCRQHVANCCLGVRPPLGRLKNRGWNCDTNETNGTWLKKLADTRGISINYPMEPTHIPYNETKPTTTDIFLMKNIANYTRAKANSTRTTSQLQSRSTTTAKRTYISFKNTDWTKFRQDINRRTIITNNISTVDQL
jgi:hypothetical protein